MVCIQCYLPPILFMIYLRLIHPWLGPLIMPLLNRILSVFGGPRITATGDACPLRPKKKADQETACVDETEASTSKKND